MLPSGKQVLARQKGKVVEWIDLESATVLCTRPYESRSDATRAAENYETAKLYVLFS
jgi:hypothetical protein